MFGAHNALLTLGGAPLYDVTGAGTTGTGTAKVVTETHVLAAGANCILVGANVGATGTMPTVTAKIGTTSIPMLGSANIYFSTTWQEVIFGLISNTLPTGSQTITVTCSAGTDFVATNTSSYVGATGFGTVASTSGTGTSPSHTVTTGIPTDRIFQMFANAGTTAGAFSAYNQTSRWNQAAVGSTSGPTLIGDAPGATSITFTATTASTPSGWGSIAVPVH